MPEGMGYQVGQLASIEKAVGKRLDGSKLVL
jgi:hypothetical protein